MQDSILNSRSGRVHKIFHVTCGGIPCKKKGMLVGIKIKPLSETKAGCGSSLNWPLKEICVWSLSQDFLQILFMHSPKGYLNGKI